MKLKEMVSKRFLFLLLVLISLDQFLKYLIRHKDGFYICNSGIAFGIQIPVIIFPIIFVGIILGGIYAIIILSDGKKIKSRLNFYGFVFIVAGAIANIIDRCMFGCVIDFINIGFLNFPLFNLADIFITVGAGLIIYEKMAIIDNAR